MDGLVSTGKRISLHNIKNNLFDAENFFPENYAHFFSSCGFPITFIEVMMRGCSSFFRAV
jgi:hypothetical protein